MKILMITPYVPYPPSSGGQIRTLNLLKYLSKKNKITLVCLYKEPSERKHLKILKKYCKEIYFCQRPKSPWTLKTIFKSVFSLNPFLIVRNFSWEAKTILEKILLEKKFDIIHVETFYVMPHLPKVKIPVFLVEQTIEYKVYQHFVNSLPIFIQPFFLIDIIKLKFWERYYWKKADQVATVSLSDKKIINQLEPLINVEIIPNCAGDEMIAKKLVKKNLKEPIFLFQGNFLWLQNIEAANILIKKIYPLIEQKIKKFQLIIAGQFANKKLGRSKMKNLKIIDIPPEKNYIVKKLYQKATLFLAPIYGPGGTRLKILAAMAIGLPVISTKVGVSGLNVIDKKNVLIANNPLEFVKKITFILSDEKFYHQVRLNGQQLIKTNYNWQSVSHHLENVYNKLISK